jgi:hypothetical protein
MNKVRGQCTKRIRVPTACHARMSRRGFNSYDPCASASRTSRLSSPKETCAGTEYGVELQSTAGVTFMSRCPARPAHLREAHGNLALQGRPCSPEVPAFFSVGVPRPPAPRPRIPPAGHQVRSISRQISLLRTTRLDVLQSLSVGQSQQE